MRVATLLGCCIVTLSISCGEPGTVFEETQALGDAGWRYTDSISFDFSVADTSSRYDMVLSVDHTTDFPYQNFYVRLTTHLPEGPPFRQPLSLQLADNFGEWYGECTNNNCTTQIALQEATRFTTPGDYRLVVGQYSRADPLPAITSVGFKLLKR